jgi:predicted RNase H-like HicB family nuclease
MSNKENNGISEALESIQKIFDKYLKDYTQEERKQLAEKLMDDYRSGKE